MKNIISFLTISIFLISCEKSNENATPLQVSYNEQILDGYHVISIAFDRHGNAWIGTLNQGLIKYNTNETIVYNSENSVVSDAPIWDIAVDSKNNVWIGCEGLIKYDGTEFTYFNSKNTPIPEDNIYSIAIDSKDNVWFSSCRFQQGGLVKYDGINWTVYIPDNSELPYNLINGIAIDKNDNVWLSFFSCLARISGDKWKIYTSDDLGFEPYDIVDIQVNDQNKLCGAINYSHSSMFIDGPQVFIFDDVSTKQLKNDNLLTTNFITVDNQDNIWCGILGGFAVYNGQEWTVDNSSFKEVSVFAIEQSNDNKIWIGTGNGIRISD